MTTTARPPSLLIPTVSKKSPRIDGVPVLRKGFRLFFLLATLYASASIALWVCVALGTFSLSSHLGGSWHAHEMIFGYSAAVIAGFLLTAVGNWTKRETLVGPPLALLGALWIAGRIACILPFIPAPVAAAVDVAFLPALALALAIPIVQTKNFRNLVMIAVLLVLAALNLTMHLTALGVLHGWERRASVTGVYVVVFLCSLISGRVIPMFTRNATGVETIRTVAALERAALVSLLCAGICELFPDFSATPWVAGIASVLGLARSATWGARHSLRVPLLWVLHVGYLWIPIGLLLRFATLFWPMLPSLPTHAFTVGALGSLTLGMMARVSLGHTGRLLVAPKLATLAFVLVNLAAVVRVGLPLFSMTLWRHAIHVSGTLFSLATLSVFVAYVVVWLTPRTDGAAG
ncbi:MAG: NnrS family protein [Polyangiaceae bacterium]